MTAKIRGSVIMPNQTPVRVTINAAPIPAPRNAGNGAIIPGDIVVDQTLPVDVDVLPGTYRLVVYTSTQVLAASTVILNNGDVFELASILTAPADPGYVTPPNEWL